MSASTSSLHAALGSRDARDPETLSGELGLDLVAHQADVFGLRADECDLVLLENVGETRVLGEKTVAWMNGVRAGDLARRNDRGNVEIAVTRRRRTDAYALVGELDVHRVPVGGRIDRDGRDAELLGRAHDPERDFATVGDQDFIEHRGGLPGRWGGGGCLRRRDHRSSIPDRCHSMIINGWSYSTGEPSATRIPTTLPARGATMSLKVFIASTSMSLSPTLHRRSDFDERLGFGTGPQIGGADHGRSYRARNISRRRLRRGRSAGGGLRGVGGDGRRLRNRGHVHVS